VLAVVPSGARVDTSNVKVLFNETSAGLAAAERLAGSVAELNFLSRFIPI
jgi:hypothetical protein